MDELNSTTTQIRSPASTVCCPVCQQPVDRSKRVKGTISLLNCRRCDFYFAPPATIGGGAQLAQLYEELYHFSEEYQSLLQQAEKRANSSRLAFAEKVFLRFFPQPIGEGRLLDVGCGAGGFLAIARRRGWQVEGIEISPKAAEIARQQGFSVFCGDLEGFLARFPNLKFDVVTAFEVIEHVPAPIGFLQLLREVTKPSGYVFLSMPNVRDPFIFVDPRPETWPPVHLNFFSRVAITQAIRAAGLIPLVVTSNWLPRATMRQVVRSRLVRALLRPPLFCLRLLGLIEGNQIAALACRPAN